MTTTTEPDLFRGYTATTTAPDDAAGVGQVVLDRIRELVGYRRWYRSHVGWIVASYTEDMAELRLLLGLRRRARRQRVPEPLPDHPQDGYSYSGCDCRYCQRIRRQDSPTWFDPREGSPDPAPDAIDQYKAAADRGLSYHDVQAR